MGHGTLAVREVASKETIERGSQRRELRVLPTDRHVTALLIESGGARIPLSPVWGETYAIGFLARCAVVPH
jgi:hypothetical protein